MSFAGHHCESNVYSLARMTRNFGGVQTQMRAFDRLFAEAHPEADGKDFLENLNPNSLSVVTAYVEPSLGSVAAGERFQFERHGYFVTDLKDHAANKVVFNRVTGMKDSWGK